MDLNCRTRSCMDSVAPVLDILIYSEPVNKVFAQGAFAAVSNIISTAVVGTILLAAYANKNRSCEVLEKKTNLISKIQNQKSICSNDRQNFLAVILSEQE